MALISPSRRLRRTPFSDGVEAAGVKAYTVYNRMLLPTVFRSVEEDYAHLKSAVQVWDVNDPVAVKLAEDRWWISIADSDLLLWVKGIANGYRLDVLVDEPDVSPLAVQGPKADDLMARVFGDAVRDIRFFRFGLFEFQGRSLVVARSGYSKQGGFEIYVEGGDIGMPLWHALFEAGKDLDVHAGCPNAIERIEGGLLSYGNDMTDDGHRLYRARCAVARGQGWPRPANPRHRDRRRPRAPLRPCMAADGRERTGRAGDLCRMEP